MGDLKKIKNALISVYYKDHLEDLVKTLAANNVNIYSTGGTQSFIENLGVKVNAVENLTSYPSILGGRVKTLHPKVFGGILGRRELNEDIAQLEQYEIPEFDLVVVNLYPFEETVSSGASEQEIIEKIDIGGVSLIRAAAKNFKDVMVVASPNDYQFATQTISEKQGFTSIDDRKQLAANAFDVTRKYDTAIANYFSSSEDLTVNFSGKKELRYGENPHQKGYFYGNIDLLFNQLHGKELSYNNLLDVDAAINLIDEFKSESKAVFTILKHNNASGLAVREKLLNAYKDALAADPVSAFGGILITNKTIDAETAKEIDQLFCEVVIAPDFETESLEILKSKKNRIILQRKTTDLPKVNYRTALNGLLVQDKDDKIETAGDLNSVTNKKPSESEIQDLLFANKIVKQTKSNTIVLAKNGQLLASGTGQTSRVDALKQAIHKAKSFNFDLKGAVMASDAFFPFPDCVEIANKEGINSVIQPGGSIKDEASINYCNENNMSMVFTGIRHFKH